MSEEFFRLVSYSDHVLLDLCRRDERVFNFCNSSEGEKLFQYKSQTAFPELCSFKEMDQTWKNFYYSMLQFLEWIGPESQQDQLYMAIRSLNVTVFRIALSLVTERVRIGNTLLRELIEASAYEMFHAVIYSPQKNKNVVMDVDDTTQVFMLSRWPLEQIERNQIILTDPRLVFFYDLTDLKIFEFLLAEKTPEYLSQKEVQFLLSKAVRTGKYDVTMYFLKLDFVPTALDFYICLQKGHLELASYIYSHNIIQELSYDKLLFPIKYRIPETCKWLEAVGVHMDSQVSDVLCAYGSPQDIKKIQYPPTYHGVLYAIEYQNYEVLKWLLREYDYSIHYLQIQKKLNETPISELDMLIWLMSQNYIFSPQFADISAVHFQLDILEFLSECGILPTCAAADELVRRCKSDNLRLTLMILNWMADRYILPDRSVYNAHSLHYDVRMWCMRRGVVPF